MMVIVAEASTSSSTPRRGRPRSSEADEAILLAALDIVGEVGISAMSMDQLARRADVSKATIYRRWESKEALVLAALSSALNPIDSVDTGSLSKDLGVYLHELVVRFERSSMNDVLPHLIEAGCHDPAIQASLDDWVQIRRRPLREIYRRAQERGEIGEDLDVDILIDVTIGPFVYRRLLTHERIDAAFVDRLVGVVLPAILATQA